MKEGVLERANKKEAVSESAEAKHKEWGGTNLEGRGDPGFGKFGMKIFGWDKSRRSG